MRIKKLSICLVLISLIIVLVFCAIFENKKNEALNVLSQEDNEKEKIDISKVENENKTDNNSGNINEEKVDENKSEDNIENLSLNIFIPNGGFKVESFGSDSAPSFNYIKGDGTSYEVIGTSGKGPFVEVFSIIDNKLYMVKYDDLTNEQMQEVTAINYLNDSYAESENIALCEPIKVGTRWDNKEIVEVGENLKLDGLTLEGPYIKIWERIDSETTKVSYYSKGLGCVKYKIIMNNVEMEHFTLIKIN